MLKGIPDIIGSDVLKALADMGHGDIVVIADHFYPPKTMCPPYGVSFQAKGNSAAEMVDAILKLMPLDTDYCDAPIEYMVPDKDSGVVMEERPKVWEEVIEAAVANGYDAKVVGEIERTKFYEKAKQRAYLTICTSEKLPYGCVMMQKGVL